MSELYLSRLQLDPRQHEVQRALADCHVLHQAILAAFPTATTPSAREEFGVLYRLEIAPESGTPTLLVQSVVRPDWTSPGRSRLLFSGTGPACKEASAAYAAIAPATRLRFRLRANPTRRVNASHAAEDPLAGKRVDLRDEEAQRDWLRRKGEQCGFQIAGASVRPGDALGPKQAGWKGQIGDRRRLTFATAIFDGILEVTDAEAFRGAVRAGIGPGKAYGFGLLSVAPVRG